MEAPKGDEVEDYGEEFSKKDPLVTEKESLDEMLSRYRLQGLPGGAKTLELVEILLPRLRTSLNEIFGNWKDSTEVLQTCEDFVPFTEEVHIVTRCINSLAMKACVDPNIFSWPMSARSSMKSSDEKILWNGISTVEKLKLVESDW